jgi:carbamoyltransferase
MSVKSSKPRILGLSAFFHDSSAALVVDGEIVAAAAEERFSQHKHDSNFPYRAIQFCLEEASLDASELDAVVFYEDPYLKFSRILASTLAEFPRSLRTFVGGMEEWLGSKLWLHLQISRKLQIDPGKIRFVSHHESHAAQTFLISPFSESAILVVDAVGEWKCTSIAHGMRDGETAIRSIESLSYPNSLGLAYAAFTAFLGFRPNEGEASVMALAAFGTPRFSDKVRSIIRSEADGTYRLSPGYFDFLNSGGGLFTRSLVQLFGAPRDHRTAIPFDALDDHVESGRITEDDRKWADIASSVQFVVEETLLGLARRSLKITGSRRLCMAGGVALNAVANSRILEESGAVELFIPPDPGDGGAAIGAALLESRRIGSRPVRVPISPYAGKAFRETDLHELAQNSDPREWREHILDGCKDVPEKLTVEQFCANDLKERIVEDLLKGRIVGWVQGRFEIGPRALGNRSILADPGNLATVRRLSESVKKRAKFRPYALSIREEDANLAFDFEDEIPLCARWMLMVKQVRPEVVPLVRGAIHTNGTTRVQVCSRSENAAFHDLLSGFGERRGLGAILNTSFNERGYPMVSSPIGALLMFARTAMDVLVVENLAIHKVMGEHNVANAESHGVALGTAVGYPSNV